MTFVNDFPFKNVPKKLQVTKVVPQINTFTKTEISDDGTLFRFTATVARNISSIKSPVASKGNLLISRDKLDLEKRNFKFYSSMGVFDNISVTILDSWEISKSNPEFSEIMIAYLNRTLDENFKSNGYSQDERFYWHQDNISPIQKFAEQRIGVFARTVCLNSDTYMARIDYRTSLIGKQTIWDIIQEEMKRQNVADWRQLDLNGLELLGGVYRVFKTTYVDYYYGDPIYRTFVFDNLLISRSVSEEDEKGFIPRKYQEDRQRIVNPLDQPVLMCKDSRSRPEFGSVSCIPSQLVPIIRIEDMKRISSAFSASIQEEAQPDSLTRYQEILDIVDFLLDDLLLYPQEITKTVLGPLTLEVSASKTIEVEKDQDFREIFAINKLSIKPIWRTLMVVYDERETQIVRPFIELCKRQFELFKLQVEVQEKSFTSNLVFKGEAYVRDYSNHIISVGKQLNYQNDLLLVIRPTLAKENMKFPINRSLTVGKELATQFIVTDTFLRLQNDLKRNLVNPLFMQLILKMGGFVATYKEHKSLKNSVFIGIDRHRALGRVSINASAVALGSNGRYLSSYTPTFDSWKDDAFGDINIILEPILLDINEKYPQYSDIVLLREGGPGKAPYILDECNRFKELLSKYNLTGSFIVANKSSGIRIFEGDPEDDESIEKPPQYTGIYQYPSKDSFVITTTQTVRKDRGTPKPMVYQILFGKRDIDTQLSLMQTLAGLSRVGTLSSRSTRLPLPLHFSHTFAKFVADVGATWPNPIRRPLYL